MDEKIFNYACGNKDVIIRSYNSSDPVNEITKLLHTSYKKLADMGFRYMATHQDDRETESRLTKGKSYIALSDGKIISTVSLYKSIDAHNAEWYRRREVAHFGQFAVMPEYQGKGLGNFMMDIIEKKAIRLEATELALDTAEGAAHLIRYYEKRGYRFIQYVNWSVTNYRSVIMSKTLANK